MGTKRAFERQIAKKPEAGTVDVTVSQVISSYHAGNSLLKGELSGITAFKLSLWLKKIKSVVNTFEDQRIKLAKKYAGDADVVPPEKMSEFSKEITELVQVDVAIPVFPLTEHDFNGIQNANGTAVQALVELIQ